MKAAIFKGKGNIKIEEIPKPKIGENDILLKVKASGICGSDLHMYREGMFTEILCLPTEYGLIPGHEVSGEVVEIGEKVEGIQNGDRVFAFTVGGMAEYAQVFNAVLNESVFLLPESLSYEKAATIEPLANSMHAMRLGKPVSGESIVIFGAGTIGLGILQCLRASSIEPKKIIVIDVLDHRLKRAKDMGADETLNAAYDDVYQKVFESTGFGLVNLIYDGVGYIKGCPGEPVFKQALSLTGVNGRIVANGLFESPVLIDLEPLVEKQIQVIGSYMYTPAELKECAHLVATEKIDRKPIITHEFSLDNIQEAFDTPAREDDVIKIILKP